MNKRIRKKKQKQEDERWEKFLKSLKFALIIGKAKRQIAAGETEPGGFGGE